MSTEEPKPDVHECTWCHRQFKRSDRYLAHKCKAMLKHEEFRSPIGQAAWQYYQMWFKALGRTVASDQTFLSSKFYATFVTFAKFARSINLQMVDKFICIMVARKFEPSQWSTNQAYVVFLEYLDSTAAPLELVKLSVSTIVSWSEKLEIDTCDFFDVLTVQEIIVLVQKRKLTPWLLLLSKKFIGSMERAGSEQVAIMKDLIRPATWHHRLATHPELVGKIRELVAALGL